MTNITIQSVQDTLVVDSRLVAAELGILHKNFKELIKSYRVDFEEFGHLSAQSAGVKGTSSYAEFYYLNENQAYLSLTYSNNTPQVRRAKINLVKAFDEAREALRPQAPKTLIEAMEVALTALKEVEATKLLLAESEKKVVEMTPKAENWTRLCDTDGAMSISAVAKNLAIRGMGPNNLFKFLRDKGFVFYDAQGCNVPKSTLVEKGYMRTAQKYDFKRDKSYSVCVCSYKGYSFIVRQLKKAGYTIPSDTTTPNAAALVA